MIGSLILLRIITSMDRFCESQETTSRLMAYLSLWAAGSRIEWSPSSVSRLSSDSSILVEQTLLIKMV